jgi:hypothetical protein
MHSFSQFGRAFRDNASRMARCGLAALALMLGPNVAASDEVEWRMATEYPQSNILEVRRHRESVRGNGCLRFAESSPTIGGRSMDKS